MEDKLAQAKQELLEDIKLLANEISKANTFVGVISNELKFNALHEKFLVLKFLEHRRMNFELFDLPLTDDYWKKIEENVKTDSPEEIKETEELEEEIVLNVEPKAEPKVESELKKESIAEETPETNISDKKSTLPPINLDFNDRIAFLNQLCDGDSESLDLIIQTLNRIDNVNSAKEYLFDLSQEMNWKGKEEYVERLQEIALKRFD